MPRRWGRPKAVHKLVMLFLLEKYRFVSSLLLQSLHGHPLLQGRLKVCIYVFFKSRLLIKEENVLENH